MLKKSSNEIKIIYFPINFLILQFFPDFLYMELIVVCRKADIFSNFIQHPQTKTTIPCQTHLPMKPVCDGKSISKSAPVSYDNELVAPYIIHCFIKAIIMTSSSLSISLSFPDPTIQTKPDRIMGYLVL